MLSSWMQQKLIDDAPSNMMNVACHGCQAVMREQETKAISFMCICKLFFPNFYFECE